MPSFPPASGVRVLIADEDTIFAESLMVALTEGEGVDVVGIAENGRQAVELAAELRPDVILMDLKLAAVDGSETTRRIREAGLDAQLLILSGADEEPGTEAAAAAGADAYLRKDSGLHELRHAFLEVASLTASLGAKAP